jgi:pimeloyl-ACP methyl ester carboxylesterase
VARYEKDFPGYAATLELNVRQQPEGGAVRAPCHADWKNHQARTQRELMVLVHGFNNHRAEAQEAYLGFRSRQKGLIDAQHRARFDDILGDAFWPGDANFAGPLDTVDFLVYPATLQKARQTAVQLSAYLRGRSDVLDLYFVGHSMGCRVILETIALLIASPDFRARIRKVCLLAAAVPTSAVFPDGALAEAFRAAEQVEVLHSTADLVLALAFPLGQTAAGDGFFPSAIGRRGDVPRNPGQIGTHLVEGAGHSDYWGWRSTNESAEAAQLISQFLSIGTLSREQPQTSIARRPEPGSGGAGIQERKVGTTEGDPS